MNERQAGRGRLYRKYVVFFVGLVGLTLLVNGGLNFWFGYQENKAALVRVQQEKASAAAERIEEFVSEIQRQIGWTTHAQWSAEPLDQRRLDYVRLLSQVPAITEISELDREGKEQLKVSRLAMDVVGSGQDFSETPAFKQAHAQRVWFSPVYFRKGSEPYLTLAVTRAGRGAGVTVAEVNLKLIWDVITALKIGQGGYAYVVDREGRLIAHPDISMVLRGSEFRQLPQVAAALQMSGEPSASVARGGDGASVLTVHGSIAPLGWLVFVEVPLREAFAPLYGAALRSALLLALGLAGAAIAALFLARRMTRPIRTMQEGAVRIGAGDLNHRLDLKTGDELEALAEQFNRMAADLQTFYADLEQKVEERTIELRQRTEEIAELNRGLEARVAEQVEELSRVGRLKRFLAPLLAELIVSQGDEKILESHRREIVVVFCDLRGYTAFTETAEPEEVLDFLRDYHGALGPLVSRFEGTLDQFSGDGIMVFFNDPVPIPDPADRAVNMAVAMREAAGELVTASREKGRELGFGVGIAQGYATLGQIGFSERLGYTAIGTVCNVAARLCAEAKDGQILLTQRVNFALKGSVATEPVGALALKGLTQPVFTYNVPLTNNKPILRVIEGRSLSD